MRPRTASALITKRSRRGLRFDGNDMSDARWISLDREEVDAIKRAVMRDHPCWRRISFGFCVRLAILQNISRDQHYVLDEIDYLEGLRSCFHTKEATQFYHPPLFPFWHKHWSALRHLLKNIGVRWSLDRQGNDDLDKMIRDVARAHGADPDRWPGALAHRLWIGGYEDRVRQGLTGDWLIFARHDGQNYYLDLATHEEGRDPNRLYEKLRSGSSAEFPFLFGIRI